MKKIKDLGEIREAVREMVQESVRDAVKEAVREKAEAFREMPVSKPIEETAKAICGMSVESAKLILKFVQCFSVFITLVYAVRQLIKEIKSPL